MFTMKFKSLIILMNTLKNRGVEYISRRPVRVDDAVMFDIDDTLIFKDGTPNTPMIELLHIARNLGYKIVIITARPGMGMVIGFTQKQLHKYKITYDYLGFTSARTKTYTQHFQFRLQLRQLTNTVMGSSADLVCIS